jgi:UDP-N-acetylglucosamine--N-acetylmuramyl-(pentapeptide) pyrophosphoryl-undecaprenol N-acetylglucosamine transferase
VLIATGGTAGHVVPALAVADALRASGATVAFVGGDRAEAQLVPEAGYELHRLRVASLPRHKPLAAVRAALTDAGALLVAGRTIGQVSPDVVLGGGGYVSAPVGLAAALRRVPVVAMEADGHLGIANRMLKPVARRICTALPIPGQEGAKFLVTGRAVPPLEADRDAARARFKVPPEATLVVVFGGSLGARTINHAALAAFADPGHYAAKDLRILHAAGERDLPDLQAPGPHYDLRGYVSGFMEALVAADLVIARSGGSVWEIAAVGKPAVLIPYPYATQDHQTVNARHFEQAGAAIVIPDAELTAERLTATVAALLSDPARLAAMGAAATAAARPTAAADIAAEVLTAAGAKR